MTRLIFGGDGGQTKSLGFLVDEQGQVLGVGRGGPSNHYDEPGGPERYRSALHAITRGAFEDAGLDLRQEIWAACYGLTGNWHRAEGVMKPVIACRHFLAVEDTLTAHAGALAGQPGIVLIVGTGAVAYGRTPAGISGRAGGLGYLLSDEGAGFDIGLQGLRAAVRAVDGRGPHTSLVERFLAHFGKPTLDEIAAGLYAHPEHRTVIARLCRIVTQESQAGDPAAQEIMAAAAEELALCVAAVARQLDWTNPVVSPTGGVIQAGEAILGPFRHSLQARLPEATLVPARYPPVVGAVLLAFQTGGIAVDARTLEKLDQGLSRLEHPAA
jgi:N-acetylglucosamine kinase-like BadF-type ATPase